MANNSINGYFKIDIREDGCYIQLYSPKNEGKPIDTNEVIEYIEKHKIYNCNVAELGGVIKELSGNREYKLCDEMVQEIDETSVVRVTNDRMMAYIRLYPASKKGILLDKKGIMGELARDKIKYGISEKVVDAILNNKMYCRDIAIAKGKSVREGKSASIEYHFNTNPTAQPKLLEDGTVDFHQLNIFSKVKKGDVLATLTPADFGDEGIDVYGNKVPPHKVKSSALKYGRNISISADGLQIISEVDGDVKLEGDTVFVSDTYTVAADVDASTGDIEYEGNVVVTGNVRTGFSVKAKGDIEVKGVVEGANIIAGGNIVLKQGMQGMNKGLLQAGNDIVTKFIQNGTAVAEGCINAGSILHSNVSSKDKVIVKGRKAFIIGGNISAKNIIEATSVGNKMETITNLQVGIDASVIDEMKELDKKLEKYNDDKIKMVQMLTLFKKHLVAGLKLNNDQTRLLTEAGAKIKTIDEGIKQANERLAECNELISLRKDGRIIVSKSVYPGVRVTISNRIHYVREERTHCQFKLEAETVVVAN